MCPVASWFETREDALLTMRVRGVVALRGTSSPHPEEARSAVSKDGCSVKRETSYLTNFTPSDGIVERDLGTGAR
jgi:hypothetical protein